MFYYHVSSRKVQNNSALAWFLEKLNDRDYRQSLFLLFQGSRIGEQFRLPFPPLVQSDSCRSCPSGPSSDPSFPDVRVTILRTPGLTFVSGWEYSVSITLVMDRGTKLCGHTTDRCACQEQVHVMFSL